MRPLLVISVSAMEGLAIGFAVSGPVKERRIGDILCD